MSLFKKLMNVLALSALIALTYCSKPKATGDYNDADVGKINKVVPGVIISQRLVNVYNKPVNSTAASTAVSTGAAAMDNDVTRRHGYEYVIKLESGSIVSIVQTENLNLKPKQHILVIYGNTTRVVPDEGSEDL